MLSQNLCRLKVLSFMQLKSKNQKVRLWLNITVYIFMRKDMALILTYLQEGISNHFPHLLKRTNNTTVPEI